MPIYEYECRNCGETIECWQKISDSPLSVCESCGGELHKVISQSSFHLKGSGWYVTDYAKGGSNGAGSKTTNTAHPSKDGKASSKTGSSATASAAAG